MLDRIPMELVRRAREDWGALSELCALLKPSVAPLLRKLGEIAPDKYVGFWFILSVRELIRSPEVSAVQSADLSGMAFARMMLELREAMERRAKADWKQWDPSRGFEKAPSSRDAILGGGESELPASSPLSVYVDLSKISRDEVVELLVGLSDLYRSIGGDGLVIRTVGTMEPALLPTEA